LQKEQNICLMTLCHRLLNKMTLLEICIPTFNRENYVKSTILQFIKYIEEIDSKEVAVLVSDNGSKDNTIKTIKKLTKKHGYIRIIKNRKDHIFSKNMVNIIKNSQADYLWFFADDDVLDKNTLPKIIKILKETKPNFIIHNYYTFNEKGITNSNLLFTNKDIYYQKKENSFEFFKRIANGVAFVSANIVKREIAEKFKHDSMQNNYWHFLKITEKIFQESGLYIVHNQALGQRTTTQNYHENIELKYNTFFVSMVEILKNSQKILSKSEFYNFKKAFKKYIMYNFYTFAIMKKEKKYAKKEKYICKHLKKYYYDLYLIYLSMSIPTVAAIYLKLLEQVRKLIFKK